MSDLFEMMASKTGDQVRVIAIKLPPSEWHYFDDSDRALDQHPEFMRNRLKGELLDDGHVRSDGQTTLSIQLNEQEKPEYYCSETGTFVYKDKPLKTVDACKTVENKTSTDDHVLTKQPFLRAFEYAVDFIEVVADCKVDCGECFIDCCDCLIGCFSECECPSCSD